MCQLTLRNEGASMSSYWKDHRIKAYNPFKTTEFSPRWGTGTFTCIHSLNDKDGAWWKLDFGYQPTIAKISILNRADCCGKRLDGANVSVGDKVIGTIQGAKDGEWITLNTRTKGSSLKI